MMVCEEEKLDRSHTRRYVSTIISQSMGYSTAWLTDFNNWQGGLIPSGCDLGESSQE